MGSTRDEVHEEESADILVATGVLDGGRGDTRPRTRERRRRVALALLYRTGYAYGIDSS